MNDILWYLLGLAALKSLLVGSDFNLWDWYRCGKRYTTWYKNRETFDIYMKEVYADRKLAEEDDKEWADTEEDCDDDWYSRTFD